MIVVQLKLYMYVYMFVSHSLSHISSIIVSFYWFKFDLVCSLIFHYSLYRVILLVIDLVLQYEFEFLSCSFTL